MIKWNDFICFCPLNYTGKTCDIRVWCASNPCVMGSQCVDLPDGYECKYSHTHTHSCGMVVLWMVLSSHNLRLVIE